MRLGILETGRPPEELASRFPTYAGMIEALLKEAAPDISVVTVPVLEGRLPERPDEQDGWVITGSKFGVYDDVPWIPPLEDFLRRSIDESVPVAGICFGHQVLARAMGAKVGKAEIGWRVGPHDYEILARPSWMADGGDDRFVINAMHQDQVQTVPPSASLIARSPFCPVAALAYGDRAISFQGHPEFDNDYERTLIEARRGSRIPPGRADPALAALEPGGRARDAARVARWIMRFFDEASNGRPVSA